MLIVKFCGFDAYLFPGMLYFVSSGNEEYLNRELKVVYFAIFSYFPKIYSYCSYIWGTFKTSPMWSVLGCFICRLISMLPIPCMLLIRLKMSIFSCKFVPGIPFFCGMWWCEGCYMFPLVIYWRNLSWPVSLWLYIFTQW